MIISRSSPFELPRYKPWLWENNANDSTVSEAKGSIIYSNNSAISEAKGSIVFPNLHP